MIQPAHAEQLLAWLRARQRLLLVSHCRPDGDALGSLAALALICQQVGPAARVLLFEPYPPRYELLRNSADWLVYPPATPLGELPDGPYDGLVIADTCSLNQLEPIAGQLGAAPPTLVLDHHATRDAIGERPGDTRIIDESAAACCLVLGDWVRLAGLRLTPELATALFVGLATDTGWFRYSNTDGRTLRLAAELAEAGASPNEIHAALYQQDSAARLRLIARLLASLELHGDGLLALLVLRPADFAAAGADPDMTEDMVNEVGRLGGIEAAVLLTEEADGVTRANFRSRRWLNVAALAAEFGGGGHVRAAGARVAGPLEDVRGRVLAAALARIEQDRPDHRQM